MMPTSAPASSLSLPAAFVALVAGAIAMGASPVFVRWAAAEGVGPFASAFWRTALALPALYAWMRWEATREKQAGPVPAAAWSLRGPVVVSGLFFAGDLFFWHLAIMGTTVANATFLATTMPVWVVLASVVLFKARIGRPTLGGLSLCVLGGGLLMGQSYSYAPERLMGDLYGLTTAVFFAGYFLTVRAAREAGFGSARITFVSTSVTTLVLLVVALAEGRLIPSTSAGWGTLLALALVSQVAGQGLLAIALGTLPAIFSSLVIFLEAVAAAALGWVLLGEALDPPQLAGGLAILLGIWIARPRKGVTA